MNTRELDLLEKCFEAEISGAMYGISRLYPSKSKVAVKLESEGYLKKSCEVLQGRFPVKVEGYELTVKGHAAYCLSNRCDETAAQVDCTD